MKLSLDGGTKVFSTGPSRMTKMTAMPLYVKNTFSGTKRPMTLKIGTSGATTTTTNIVQMLTLG